MDSSPEKIVVLDFDIPQLFNNQIFNPEQAVSVHHTILPVSFLAQQAKQAGITLMTQDVFFALKTKPKNVLLMSGLKTPYTEKLITAGARPVIITCQESPFIATRFYINLKKYSALYKYAFVFSGMRKHLSQKTIYRQMFFPTVYDPAEFNPLPFSQKKFLTMISGNKHMGNWKKNLLLKLFYGFGVREIYSVRQKIINYFAQSGKFDLYGLDWDRGGRTSVESGNIKKVYRGRVANKLPVLRQYKFAFCLENSIFPGYVTEKILDAMFAGCVPVYLGAPDAASMIPQQTFINLAKFKSLVELDSFLSSMTEEVHENYLKNIRQFLNSDLYQKFSYQNFNNQILEIFNREFALN